MALLKVNPQWAAALTQELPQAPRRAAAKALRCQDSNNCRRNEGAGVRCEGGDTLGKRLWYALAGACSVW